MSLGVWSDKTALDDELRLCSERSSDSDSQLELNRSLSELIESITCGDDAPPGPQVVADIVECILDRVEEEAGAPRRESAGLSAEQIDEGSRDRKAHHRRPKALRRKRDRSDPDRKKSRRRSTSCSTTSSACSEVSRKNRRKHNSHERRKLEDSTPRVKPIFLWVKQDDTRIVEVLCEDYDKRNRIRLTKTAHGWKATPRTERLDSTLSRSSLDLSPTSECPPLVSEVEADLPQTKEKKAKRCASRKYKRCDKRKDKSFKENNYLDDCKNVDVVNNNNNSISNNNKIKVDSIESEPTISEPRLRSFGYKKACHASGKVVSNSKRKDNNSFEDIDIYTFVPTPKTDEENDMDEDFGSESDSRSDVDLIPKPEQPKVKSDVEENKPSCKLKNDNPQSVLKECKVEEIESSITNNSNLGEHSQSTENCKIELISESKEICDDLEHEIKSEIPNTENTDHEIEVDEPEPVQEDIPKFKEEPPTTENHQLEEPHSSIPEPQTKPDVELPQVVLGERENKQQSNSIQEEHDEPKVCDTPAAENTVCTDVNTISDKEEIKLDEATSDVENEEGGEEEEEEQHPEVILPELHLQTPEPSPQPVPEPSSVEPESILTEISLQPDTSLDSDTIHLPDTTTKSDTSLLISTDISLGQKLSIKPHSELTLESSLLAESLHRESKSLHRPTEHSEIERKTASMLHQAEIERQITADLDEDHLLAIEEILQGEECVEDFDDDDLPEEYPVSHESPVNLVIDLKTKDQVDNTGIPLSLRTDDFLEIFPAPISMKEHSDVFAAPTNVEKPIPPAHQQSKTKFLESILSCPKRCHKENKKADSTDQQEPLYLGVSRKSASPTVSSSDGRKFSSPELEPKPKRMKVEDITLKTILNRNKETFPKTKVSKSKDKDHEETQQTADSTTKSRLLELLTNENDEHINKLDPLTQLKEVLSDPDLNVPDPLLVPRTRLPALVANPAKEIPRLLAVKSENLSYPKLLTDPDLLVVSLSHLQSLLQAAGKEEEMLKYQQHAQLLQQQMKQEQSTLDAATATALNQMMWLPYLSQLEAAAVACGNTQDFMAMLNMVFPSGTYPQMSPYMMTPPSPGINAYDYKSQLEFQQAFALWNEAMMQAATNQFAAQSLGNNNNVSSKLYQNYQDSKYTPKSHSNSISKSQEAKHTSARTSPITLNYQQNKYRASQYPYTSMFSIPTSTPTTSLTSATTSPYRTTHSSQSQQSYQNSRQRSYNYSNYSSLRPPSANTTLTPKCDPPVSAITSSDFYKSQQRLSNCKSLVNILSKPKQSEVKSHVSKAYPTSTTMLPKDTTIRMATVPKQEPPKLKVKQPQHLVDPNSRPKLLNLDEHGEVGSTTGSLTPHVDETHPNLWHPLFSRFVRVVELGNA